MADDSSDGNLVEESESASSEDQKDSLADVVSSHCPLDELDYEEFIGQSDPIPDSSCLQLIPSIGITQQLLKEEEEEEGELTSDEEGEIKDDPAATPTVLVTVINHNERSLSCSPIPPTGLHSQHHLRKSPTQQSSLGVCRHFLQGRCSWGDICRFSHSFPPDYSPSRNRSVSPQPPPSQHSRYYPSPPPPPPLHLSGLAHAIFPLRFPPPIPPPHPFEGQPFPYASFNTCIHPQAPALITPSFNQSVASDAAWTGAVVEKEENEGWLRLRTITAGGGEDTPEEAIRLKIPMKLYESKSKEDSSDDSDTLRKKASKRAATENTHESSEQWVDPWSRGNQKVKKEDEEEEVEKERRKEKRKEKKKKAKKHKKRKRRSSGSDGDGEMSPLEGVKKRSQNEPPAVNVESVWSTTFDKDPAAQDDVEHRKRSSRKHKKHK